jgi:hypothetical protein
MWFFLAIWWLIKLAVFLGVGWWIYDDSKSRDRNPFFWLLAIALIMIGNLFFGVGGFWMFVIFVVYIALYLWIRPKGELIYCVECFKKKLEDLKYCPHCYHIEEDAFEEDNNDDTTCCSGSEQNSCCTSNEENNQSEEKKNESGEQQTPEENK